MTRGGRHAGLSCLPPQQHSAAAYLWRGLILLLTLLVRRPTLAEDIAASTLPEIASLSVEPAEIVLGGAVRRQHLLITATTVDGRLLDVTQEVELAVSDPALARAVGNAVVGQADGLAELSIRVGVQSLAVPIRVERIGQWPEIHFANDVAPLFSKLGCNSGGCHGKATGPNGFRLSVFGFDPRADFEALVKEDRGRRLFPAAPERSLLVAKATARLAHGGGRRIEPQSEDETLLVEWIRQGMPWGREDAARLVGLEVRPEQRVLPPQATQHMLATALYSDGSRRDVTAAASYTSNAPRVADLLAPGQVQTGELPGEAAITVNYMGQVAAVRLLVPRPGGQGTFTELAPRGPIDELVLARLRTMGIAPSPLADDVTFFRRVSLDLIGTLPTPDEARQFLADTAPEKRAQAIDRLLARDEFADLWALKWADILLVDRDKLGDRGAYEFHRWLREAMANGRPYDEWVRELITASGNSGKHGAVNFFRAQRTPEDLARSVSQAFLGIRLDCAQCHHHPFERWGQEDFYGLAGYFNGLERKPLGGGTARELVYHAGIRPTTMPLTGVPVPTHPPGGETPDLSAGDPRVALAAWMTAPENPWFARLIANRLWKHCLGRGLIEPEDDLRATNPATNEPLLDYLAGRIAALRYDVKGLLREIAGSQVYQLSSVPNETNADDEQNFSHYRVKRLSAEVLLDAICQATAVPEEFPGMPAGTRAIQLWDNRLPSYFLEIFGRPERTTPCECGRTSEPTLSQALHLMNAPEIDAKVSSSQGRIARLIETGASPDAMVQELTLAAVGRMPNAREQSAAAQLFAAAPPEEAAEDYLWALLNSYDFLFVH